VSDELILTLMEQGQILMSAKPGAGLIAGVWTVLFLPSRSMKHCWCLDGSRGQILVPVPRRDCVTATWLVVEQ
jgi:hypothetical protein